MGAVTMKTPGLLAFLQPNPVLQISTGATSQTQGQFSYALSGSNPSEVYDLAGRFLQKMYEFPGFLFVNSDMFNHTPSLQVDILRDQAKLYGISEARILSLLRSAYSQNYVYLIKKPNNQYQVILEVQDNDREDPQDLNLLYIKSDDGQRMVPLRAVTAARTTLGPQAVNHINQFTSVTFFFNLMPGFAIGQATDFVERAAKQIVPGDVRGSFQGEALTFRETVSSLTILMVLAVFVMYVILAILYESYLHPITVLSSLPVALVGGLLTLWVFDAEASLYAFIGMFMLMGIVKKNGIMIVDFAQQRVRAGPGRRRGHSRCEHGPLPPDHDDHAGGADGRAADRPGLRRRRRFASAAGAGHRRRTDRVPVHHALRHAGHLSLSRRIPGERAGPHELLPVGPLGAGDRGGSAGLRPFRPRPDCSRGARGGGCHCGVRLHRRSEVRAARRASSARVQGVGRRRPRRHRRVEAGAAKRRSRLAVNGGRSSTTRR